MTRYILFRLGQAIITLIIVLLIVFVVLRVTCDPLPHMLPEEASKEDYALLRSHLGLDKPVFVQFGIFVKQMATGNFGLSMYSRQPVSGLVLHLLPNSVMLGILAMAFALLLGLPLGVVAAVNRERTPDILASVLAALGQALPQFWIGLVLMQIFSIKLRWLPVATMGNFATYILPALTLSTYIIASVTRLTRSSMLEALGSEYIIEARVKGVSEAGVVLKHALRNALIPVVTFAGLYLAFFVGGAVVVETVFAWPGVGRLLIQAVTTSDFPVVQAVVLLMCASVIVMNLLVDILYSYIDPRICY